ncbi:Nnf1-domain-containing protein [Phialemonium atrogriseum]|uniref:Nnf1-domain-containing protein n=1 Tax=Phialemonium atrogriseum TaxID=1093897 RepID=A0AAJ0C380_9PEZI|nr:Nnf1-domain-containing protein [Phialemonium atrogriseum]KAK1769328.1 Nnf1-domain-containing protein [Phialemonium atrogriseum]
MATEPDAGGPDPIPADDNNPRSSGNPKGDDSNSTAGEPPASPPLPAKHVPATPGPRAAGLREVYRRALERTLERVSWDNVAACYPTVAARAPATLRAVQGQMVGLLREKCDREFESILQNRNVVAKLNELESLVGDAARRKSENPDREPPVPPHLLPADDVLAAHLAPQLASQQSQLNARLQTAQAHNARLFEEIRAQRAEAAELVAAVERVLADMDGASELLGGVADDLAAEARAVEVEMSGT